MGNMAKTRSAAHLVPYQFRPAAAPIVVTRTRTVHAKPKRKGHRKGHSIGSLTPERLFKIALGGAVAGFVEKSFGAQLPTIPMIGRKGTLTVVMYFLAKNSHMDLLKDATIAIAGISGYELGSTGKISGDVLGDLASQV